MSTVTVAQMIGDIREAIATSQFYSALGLIDELDKSIELYDGDAAEKQRERVVALCLRASCYELLSRLHESRKLFQQALDASTALEDNLLMATSYNGLFLVATRLSLTKDMNTLASSSLEYAEKAVAELSANPELLPEAKKQLASSYSNTAITLSTNYESDNAVELERRALALNEEIHNPIGVAWNTGNIGLYFLARADFVQAIDYTKRALVIDETAGNRYGMGRHMMNLATIYSGLGDYSNSASYTEQALQIFEEVGTKQFESRSLVQIGIQYAQVFSDEAKALVYFKKALAIEEQIDSAAGIAHAKYVIGLALSGLGDHEAALEQMLRSQAIAEKLDSRRSELSALLGTGIVHRNMADYENATVCFKRALYLNDDYGDPAARAFILGNLGALHANPEKPTYNSAEAEKMLKEAIAIGDSLGIEDFDPHHELSVLYEHEQRFEEALAELRKYLQIHQKVLSNTAREKTERFEQRRLVAEAEHRLSAQQAAERSAAEATAILLHKVLPKSIADRLIRGEKIADYYPQVSILFADIVGFTSMAAEIPPDIVIDLLNYVFEVFDDIVTRHGCEKVKTIGDGYMVISSAPEHCIDHAERISRVALELQNDIHLPESIREFLPSGISFGVRVGIHTGSAVCGVIGTERFVWDVYSDAVNVAARMESTGESGRIQVSKDFAFLIRSRQKLAGSQEEFRLIERGEIEVKGKGMLRTYFLERA